MLGGLAIVCDEYFVPALEVIVDKMDLSHDVAGATLMAAGGSAPELFTNIVGVFILESDVGFGTIVGSAVFNILFVIGCCAMASKDVLQLTSWPLTRDCTYYIISLLVLYMFFGGDWSKNEIDLWEAIILLLLYVGYVVLMKFNERLRDACQKRMHRSKYRVKPVNNASADGSSGGTPSEPPEEEDVFHELPSVMEAKRRELLPNPKGRRLSTQFRAGVMKILINENNDVMDALRVNAVSGIEGNCEETFKRFDSNQSGFIDRSELSTIMKQVTGQEQKGEVVEETLHRMVSNASEIAGGRDQVSFEEFKIWYTHSETRVQADVHRVFTQLDLSKDGKIDRSEIKTMITHLIGKEPTDDQVEKAVSNFSSDKIDFEEFSAWYKDSLFYKDHKALHDEKISADETKAGDESGGGDEDDDEGVSLAMPSSIRGKVTWLLLLPISAPMFFTIPDVRWKSDKIKWEKFFAVTFILSIVWIAIFSCEYRISRVERWGLFHPERCGERQKEGTRSVYALSIQS